MNKRIQTLLAKFKETESTHRGAQVLIGFDEIEKFAELIVRECAEVANEHDCNQSGNAGEILNYFGVE